jgi:hypothetical protein
MRFLAPPLPIHAIADNENYLYLLLTFEVEGLRTAGACLSGNLSRENVHYQFIE